jgi:hypothetical protein
MQRHIRNYFAATCFGVSLASFASYLWLFFQYQSTRPNHPRPDLGFVHSLNNHGWYVYINDVDSTGLVLLLGIFFVGFILCFIVVPKTYSSKGIEHDLINPTPGQYGALWIAVMGYCGIIIFAGKHIAAFVVSRGLVLSP